jgi:hypothetical protein
MLFWGEELWEANDVVMPLPSGEKYSSLQWETYVPCTETLLSYGVPTAQDI